MQKRKKRTVKKKRRPKERPKRTVMEEEMFTCKLTNLALYSPDVLSHAVKVFNMHKKLERLKPTLAMLGYNHSGWLGRQAMLAILRS